MTAIDKFRFGCEFQGNPGYYFHWKPGYIGDFYSNNPRVAGGPAYVAKYNTTIATAFPKYPQCCYRNSVYLNGTNFTLYCSSQTITNALAWMGGNVSVSIEVLCRWESLDSCGDTPWTSHNSKAHFRFYTNRYQAYKSQWLVYDSTNTSRSIQESTASSATTWNHYVCVVQAGTGGSPGVFKIYRNGVQTATADWTYGNLLAPDNNWIMFFPSNNYQAFGQDGAKMRILRYYQGVLDPTEVSELYNSGSWRDIDYINTTWRNNTQHKININSGTATGTAYSIKI